MSLATSEEASTSSGGIARRTNNLFVDVSSQNWGGPGWLVLTQGGSNIVFDHNTVFADGAAVVYAAVDSVSGFVFTNNIVPDNAWAILGDGAGPGNETIAIYYPDGVFDRDVFIAGQESIYPADNFFPATVDEVGFADISAGNYRLLDSSPFKNSGTDGLDIGCDASALPGGGQPAH
jgi:hypothetical protein